MKRHRVFEKADAEVFSFNKKSKQDLEKEEKEIKAKKNSSSFT